MVEKQMVCPICMGRLEPDQDYPEDLLCGHCERAFDKESMVEIPWSP